jgi:hypothetical protein
LLLIAGPVLKPMFPSHVGLWIHPQGFELATTNATSPARIAHPGREVLGWWIIPICLAAGALLVFGMTLFLRRLLRFVPTAARRMAGLVY